MKTQCKYCKTMYDSKYLSCTNCGAVNPEPFKGTSIGPKTLEELKSYIENQRVNLDSYKMYLSEDYKEDDSICLLTDGTNWVIQHYYDISGNSINKRYDCEILYQGTEEAYAIDLLFNELQTRINNPIYQTISNVQTKHGVERTEKKVLVIVLTIMFMFFSPLFMFAGAIGWSLIQESIPPWDGYYKTESLDYYYYYEDSDRWYYYDKLDKQWELSPGLTDKQAKQYFIQTYYDEDITVPDFESSQIYMDNHYYDDYDNDY